jgi:arylformamidase
MIDPWLEKEYDNRVKVPDYAAIVESWGTEAAAFRAAHEAAELGVRYGASERQAMDIFWPGSRRDVPILLFIHGGYWRTMDRVWFSHLARGVGAHGIAVAMPSYDLCPNVTLGELVEQLRQAADFLMSRHDRDIFAAGHSAGGHLTAMVLVTDWQARGASRSVYGGCAISGLFDLAPLLQTSINDELRLDAAEARLLSPVHLPAPRARLRALVGAEEGMEFTRQARDISAAWSGDWSVVPGTNHFTVIAPLSDPASPMVAMLHKDIMAAPT